MIKGLLYLSILTTAVVASWIGFSVYHNYATSTISSDTSIRIAPIKPEFDRETIGELKAKRVIKANLSETRVQISVTPEATKSAATASGQIKL